MNIIKHSTDIPEENIALDELMLDRAEQGQGGQSMRFWESDEYFVVVGRAGRVVDECLVDICARDGIRIIRRISGGGTVLQGPGCLNYSVVLRYPEGETKTDIKLSYERILGKIACSFREKGFPVDVLPLSDMAVRKKKISGNAQARKRRYFLHHGTLLLGLDPHKINKYLKYPPREPGYRSGRKHQDFVANISMGRKEAEDIIKKAFPCDGEKVLSEHDIQHLKTLTHGKYASRDWNWCF